MEGKARMVMKKVELIVRIRLFRFLSPFSLRIIPLFILMQEISIPNVVLNVQPSSSEEVNYF